MQFPFYHNLRHAQTKLFICKAQFLQHYYSYSVDFSVSLCLIVFHGCRYGTILLKLNNISCYCRILPKQTQSHSEECLLMSSYLQYNKLKKPWQELTIRIVKVLEKTTTLSRTLHRGFHKISILERFINQTSYQWI